MNSEKDRASVKDYRDAIYHSTCCGFVLILNIIKREKMGLKQKILDSITIENFKDNNLKHKDYRVSKDSEDNWIFKSGLFIKTDGESRGYYESDVLHLDMLNVDSTWESFISFKVECNWWVESIYSDEINPSSTDSDITETEVVDLFIQIDGLEISDIHLHNEVKDKIESLVSDNNLLKFD